MPRKKIQIIALVGPNASGKSALSLKIAANYNGEIVSADSRQVYRSLDLGSGKISKLERKKIPHHLLDVIGVKKIFSVADFIKSSKIAVGDVAKRKKIPIIVGGTGFWVDALLSGMQLPAVKPDLILRKKLSKLPNEILYKKLEKLDPLRAKNIDRHNPARLVRALEIILKSKKPIPLLKNQPAYQVLWLGMNPGLKILKNKIKIRLQKRLKQGMLAEVRKLLQAGVPAKRLIELGLEYRYLTLFIQNKISREEMEQQLYRAICQYAKRQITWFKRNKKIHWVTNVAQANKLIKEFLG
ncbi:MAG: tRNA (adenosine(37)-N6)-dimethylallyltransferase MiaA [Patescibacteria group bacterium]|jgi:tRNA dimethylallyltransferase